MIDLGKPWSSVVSIVGGLVMRVGLCRFWCVAVAVVLGLGQTVRGEDLPVVRDVEFQPLSAQVKRVVEALEVLGQPLVRDEKARIRHGDRFHRR